MFFLEWNFEKMLPSCSVCYEPESYLSQTEQQDEQHKVSRLQELCEVFNALTEKINQDGFPDLCPADYKIPEKSYPLYTLAPHRRLGVMEVECQKIIGGNWANLPHSANPNYPKPRKVTDLLTGYLNLNDDFKDTRSQIPPIPVFKIFDDYFCDEGNHRLYVSRLLQFKSIKAEVIEIDYLSFLKNSFQYKDTVFSGSYIAYAKEEPNHQLFEVTEEEINQYKKLKEQYLLS